MLIKLWPCFSDDRIEVSVAGEVVTVNGAAFDLSPLEVGASISSAAFGVTYFLGYITRDSAGELTFTLQFPQDAEASEDARFPLPISVTEDGPVMLPDPEKEVPPALNPELELEPEGAESEGGEA
jgi:hypothetical protein